jgi:hypothetical protein
MPGRFKKSILPPEFTVGNNYNKMKLETACLKDARPTARQAARTLPEGFVNRICSAHLPMIGLNSLFAWASRIHQMSSPARNDALFR